MDIRVELNNDKERDEFIKIVRSFDFDIDVYKFTPNKSIDAKSELSIFAIGNGHLYVHSQVYNKELENKLKQFQGE